MNIAAKVQSEQGIYQMFIAIKFLFHKSYGKKFPKIISS
jgi:hypothetical protein